MSISHLRLAGLCYATTFVAGAASLAVRGPLGTVTNAVATAAYVAVAWLFYRLFAPVSHGGALAAMVVGLAGCAASTVALVGGRPPVHPLAIFGAYCLLIGGLIVRSTFVPRILGASMILGGVSWLTFSTPALSRALAPYNFAPGILAEGALTLWLLAGTPRPAAAVADRT